MKKQEEEWIWWKHGVVYHIYPRSFQDSDGDGVGDLRGIIRRIGYLKSLGIDAIWLSPVYKSPMADFGYDVADYRAIDPVFGTMDDFRELLDRCHAEGIRLIMDMILNHTSDQHPWFIESASTLTSPKRNWYIWKQGVNGGPPNNWRSSVGGSAWKYDSRTGEYYLHSFFEQQPDLNWRDAELPAVFFQEIRYWLDLGVDGFRLDVINMIAKDKKFRNNPVKFPWPVLQEHQYTRNRRRSVKIVKELRRTVDQYPERVCIGEVYAPPPGSSEHAARYLSNGDDGLHLAFDFSLIYSRWDAHSFFKCITRWYEKIPGGGWPCFVLSNHDLLRNTDRIPWRINKEEKARIAAFLILTLKGTPFIYYGEEIGMQNTRVGRGELRDPLGKRYWPFFSGRDQARTPMQWSECPEDGFTLGTPWLPLNRDYRSRNVKAQEADVNSLLNIYRKLIQVRRESPALHKGEWIPALDGRKGLLAYYRSWQRQRILVILNFTGKEKIFCLPGETAGSTVLSTHRSVEEHYYFQNLRIFPFEATIFMVVN